jgi:hypothetical protein
MCRNSVKLRLTLYREGGQLFPRFTSPLTRGGRGAIYHLPLFKGEDNYNARDGRPDDAPNPSIKASVPSREDSRALTSRNRA